MTVETFSGTRFAGGWFLVQGVAFAAWWLYLFARPEARALFRPAAATDLDLLAFLVPDLAFAVPVSLAAGFAFLRRSGWAVALGWAAAGAVDYALFYCAGWSALRGGGWLAVTAMAPAALLSTVAALDASAGNLTLFRRARHRPRARHVAATLLQIALFWSFFLAVVPALLLYVESSLGLPRFAFPGQTAGALLLFVAFSALGLASGLTMAWRGAGTPLPFDAPNELVVGGPYAHVRNPMVIAGLGQGLAVALWAGSWTVAAYVMTGGVLWNSLVRPAEEHDLAERFGEPYRRYVEQVRCWLPRLSPYRLPPPPRPRS